MKPFNVLALLLIACLTALPISAKKKKNPYKVPSNYELQAFTTGVEGTKVFKIWCFGKNPEEAIAEAKRAAIAACIFRGIPADRTSSTPEAPALCKDPSAQEMHKDFFARFFDEEEGAYIQFINLTTDGMPSGQDRLKMKKGYKIGIKVQVMYDNLRKTLEENKIIKRLADGFN